jgi:hypothetical protein
VTITLVLAPAPSRSPNPTTIRTFRLIGAPHANLLLLNLTVDSMVKNQGWRAMDEDD